jgi:hypothetical protein
MYVNPTLTYFFRPGDLARIDEGSTVSQAPRAKASKSKALSGKDKEESTGIEGVVYKV